MLRINSVFQSIEGEVNPWGQGKISTFIRVAGCFYLDCAWCDERGAKRFSENDIILVGKHEIRGFYKKCIAALGSEKVTITGGEPLEQEEEIRYLIEYMVKDGVGVSVETNGAIIPKFQFPETVRWIVDYKLPSSRMEHMMKVEFHRSLRECDIIKFVIATEKDYIRARHILRESKFRAITAFSPVLGLMDARVLLAWMIRDKLFSTILSVQIHKLLKMR